jgi:phosphatidylglycerophosphatase A
MQETQRQNGENLENSRAAHATGSRPQLAMWIATGLGSGFLPRAPGTFGTLVGAALVWGVASWGVIETWMGFAALLLLGWWASKEWSQYRRQSDCQEIVIDEILGIYLAWLVAEQGTLAPGPSFTLKILILFVLFRIFDVLKPWPIRPLDRWGKTLPLGWTQGGMVIVDDLLAGVIAGILGRMVYGLL